MFPGGANSKEPTCQCMRHKRCGFDPWGGKIPWRRKCQFTPVFLPGESLWTEEPGWVQFIQRVRHDWVTSHFPLPNNQKNLEKEENVTTNSVIIYKLTKFNWMCLSGPMFVIRMPTWVHANYMCISRRYFQAVPLKTVGIFSKHCTISATLWVKQYF